MHAYACIMYNDDPWERNGWNLVSIKVQTELAIACVIIECYFAINKPVLFIKIECLLFLVLLMLICLVLPRRVTFNYYSSTMVPP